MNSILVDVYLFDFGFAHLLRNCVLLTHVDISNVDIAKFIRHVEEFFLLVPADRCVEHLVRIAYTEYVLLLADAFNSLVVANSECTGLFLNIENLYHAITMHCPLFGLKVPDAVLSPISVSFEFYEGTFGIAGVPAEVLGVVDF